MIRLFGLSWMDGGGERGEGIWTDGHATNVKIHKQSRPVSADAEIISIEQSCG